MPEELNNILQAYGIYPTKIEEVTPRLFLVKDNHQTYALKKSSLTENALQNWASVYRIANGQNLASVLPVYLTKNSQLYYKWHQSIYYVTPWVEELRNEINEAWITDFYENLATVHVKTKRSQKIPLDDIKNRFQTFQSFCKDSQKQLLHFVQQFEKNRYMSPFELLVCTQFRDIDYALNEIDRRIDLFLKDSEKEQIAWNYALCHYNLNTAHVRGSYFINWEKARYDNPIMDLVGFFNREIGYYNPSENSYIDLFSSYTKINELETSEVQLFAIYLLSPGNYLQIIYEYVNSMRDESMVYLVSKLQHEYRKVLFGLKWSSYIEKEFETIPLDDLEDLD